MKYVLLFIYYISLHNMLLVLVIIFQNFIQPKKKKSFKIQKNYELTYHYAVHPFTLDGWK